MPYLIKCKNCSEDIIINELIIGTQCNCPHCNTLNYQSEYAEKISNTESLVRTQGSKITSCPSCGSDMNPNAIYCKECGTELNRKVELTIIYCPECNKEYEGNFKFCEVDGTALVNKTKSIDLSRRAKEEFTTEKNDLNTENNNIELSFEFGQFLIVMGFIQGGLALVLSVMGVQTSLLPNRGVGILISILGIGYAYGLMKRKLFGLYLVYTNSIVILVYGLIALASGKELYIIQGVIPIVISILLFIYFNKRKELFS